MRTIILILKMLLCGISALALVFTPVKGGGDFAPQEPAAGSDETKYVQIRARDEGVDIWRPGKYYGGYRYGPSMILNADGSIDVWCASNGPGDIVDLVDYKRLYDGGRASSRETIALKPTSGSHDQRWTCDPGVIKFGGYYYIGYTTTTDERGVDNDVCIARSKTRKKHTLKSRFAAVFLVQQADQKRTQMGSEQICAAFRIVQKTLEDRLERFPGDRRFPQNDRIVLHHLVVQRVQPE